MNVAITAPAKKEDVAKGSLALLFSIDDLAVTILPILKTEDELIVGRQADCDLVIDDPSVSKQHARLHWDSARSTCTIKDLDSTNGTLLNGSATVKRELPLRNGDIISFGHTHFWYLLTKTLYARLAQTRSADLIGSRSV
jgi:pSer/pThr/pTyr-binding forkhead associated (FHA) protein